MNRRIAVIVLTLSFVLSLGAVTPRASAQIAGSGTVNNIPQFSDSSTLANSTIFQQPNTGFIGIGTAAPDATLTVSPTSTADRDVNLDLNAGGAAIMHFTTNCCDFSSYLVGAGIFGPGFRIYDETNQYTPFFVWIDDHVSIGTQELGITPQEALSVVGGVQVDQNDDNAGTIFTPGLSTNTMGLVFGISSGEGLGSARVDGSPNLYGLDFFTGYAKRMSITQGGFVGIGTITPSTSLEVNGGFTLTQGSGGSVKFQDGTVQATAWNGTLNGQDYAESVSVSGDRKVYGPGDLIVMDAGSPGKFLKSAAPYSTLIAGIYSTKPGLLGKREIGDASNGSDIPMAMIGIVPTKVSAENGAIHVGDLLVTSSTPGTAMRGTDPARMMGAVLGKAMANFEAGTGVIDVLVRLQ